MAANIAEHSAKTKPCGAALVIAQLNEPALTYEYLCGKFATIFARHRPLYTLDDSRDGTPVILKLFAAIVHFDFRAPADVLVVRTFIGILKASPTTYVINKDHAKIGLAALHILY